MYRVYLDKSEVYRCRSEKKANEVFYAVYNAAEVLAKYTGYELTLDRDGEELNKIERI